MRYRWILAILFTPLPAYAYLDPGSGSLIIQVIIAGIAGFTLTSQTVWRKIKNMFTRFSDDE